MMPGVLVTCCCFTLLQTSPKRRRHPKVYSLKKGSDSENPPVCPACVVLLCHSVQNKSETGTPRQGLESFGCSALLLVFHPKPFKPFMQNHHFSIFAIKKNPPKQMLWLRAERRKQAPDGCGHSRGPDLGFLVHPQCSSSVLRRIGEDTISISDRSISIQFGKPVFT